MSRENLQEILAALVPFAQSQLEDLGHVPPVAASMDANGIGAQGVIVSPIRGAKGNREFLLHLRPGPAASLSANLAEVIAT